MSDVNDPVVAAARDAFMIALRGQGRGAHNTPRTIGKMWRLEVQGINQNCFQVDVCIDPNQKILNQTIDVLDVRSNTAYEFSVEGRDADSELYKDVVKIMYWNRSREPKITRLVFITEEKWGRKYLDTPLARSFIDLLSNHHLEVSIVYVSSAS